MPDLNRVSAVLGEADLAEIEGHLDAIRAKMPFLISLTAQERRELAKLGEKSVGFEEKCEAYMRSHPQFLPGFLSLEEINKDRALRGQLVRVLTKEQALVNDTADTAMVTGSELWKADLAYYKNVQEATKHGVSGAEGIYQDLASRFPGNSRSPPQSPAPTPAPVGQ